MAETPEHLSELGDQDQKPDTDKLSSPQKQAGSNAEHAPNSGTKGQSDTSKERRSMHGEKRDADDKAPAGD